MTPKRRHSSTLSGSKTTTPESEDMESDSAQSDSDREYQEILMIIRQLYKQAQKKEARLLKYETENPDVIGLSEAYEGPEMSPEELAHEDAGDIAQELVQKIKKRQKVHATRFKNLIDDLERRAHDEEESRIYDEVDMSREAHEKDLEEFGWEQQACPFADYVCYALGFDDDNKMIWTPSETLSDEEREQLDRIYQEAGTRCNPLCDHCRRQRMKREADGRTAQQDAADIKDLKNTDVDDPEETLTAKPATDMIRREKPVREIRGVITREERLKRQKKMEEGI